MDKELAYLLGPVRQVGPEQRAVIEGYKNKLVEKGLRVFDPIVDAPQESKTGYEIVMAELQWLKKMRRSKDEGGNPEVAVFWTNTPPYSEGSRVDAGMVLGLELKTNLVEDWGGGWGEFYLKAINVKRYLDECARSSGCGDMFWHTDMGEKYYEDERIRLGVLFSYLSQVGGFRLDVFGTIGNDVKEKSYPKVVAEIQRRQIRDLPLWE